MYHLMNDCFWSRQQLTLYGSSSDMQETTYNRAFAVIWAVQEQSTNGIRNTGRVWFSELPDHIVYHILCMSYNVSKLGRYFPIFTYYSIV